MKHIFWGKTKFDLNSHKLISWHKQLFTAKKESNENRFERKCMKAIKPIRVHKSYWRRVLFSAENWDFFLFINLIIIYVQNDDDDVTFWIRQIHTKLRCELSRCFLPIQECLNVKIHALQFVQWALEQSFRWYF